MVDWQEGDIVRDSPVAATFYSATHGGYYVVETGIVASTRERDEEEEEVYDEIDVCWFNFGIENDWTKQYEKHGISELSLYCPKVKLW